MSVRSASSLVLIASALAVPAGAGADEVTLTPDGPATLASVWTGPVTAEGRPPQVVVGWRVVVGPGGRGGPVKLQAVSLSAPYSVIGGSPVEQLPATPGTYTFAIPAGQALRIGDTRSVSMAIAQQTGGHAILNRPTPTPELGPMADLAQLTRVNVFTPALADDASGATPSSSLPGARLAVEAITEFDTDRDGLGDATQDIGDLKVLSARIVRRSGQLAEVVAHVKNVGATVRNVASISAKPNFGFRCTGSCTAEIAPGQETDLGIQVDTTRGDPTSVSVTAEGPDVTPDDNTLPLAPFVTLSAPPLAGSPAGGIRVRIGLSRPGTIKLAARTAGLNFGRTLSFTKAGQKTILLAPRKAADRRHLTRALRRPGKLSALITADAGGGAQALRLKL